MKALIKKIPKYGWILIAIIAIGIFLRSYNFHDWLRFNADQSRDATVVGNFIEGKESLPLLGPKAGGTNFRLGGIFYYFQIAAAKVFGNYPDKMAYPDLISSILSIPLLFFFLRKYFDVKKSLMLVGVFAVSFFAVKYSRFAWNPNSLPFWSILFLYSLHSFATFEGKIQKLWPWPILIGVSSGVGVQLHTLSLVFFPIMLLGMFGHLMFQKKKVWKAFFAVILIAIVFNAGQIYGEYKTGGDNVRAFFGGIGTKEKKGDGFLPNAAKDAVCFTQANVFVLSSWNSSDTCELKSVAKGYNQIIFVFGLIFFIGGLVLGVDYFRKEKDFGKKYFLGIFMSYLSLSFLVLLPLANEISMRFFLVIIFMPIILLGLWLKYLEEKFSKKGLLVSAGIVLVLIAGNVFSVGRFFVESASYTKQSDAGMDNVTLKEVEFAADFILSHAGNGTKVVFVDGDAKYLFKAMKSIEYFTQKKNIAVKQKSKKLANETPLFLIENSKQKNKILEKNPEITDFATLGRFTIFKQK